MKSLYRDTFPEVIKQLQLMNSTRLSSVGQCEAKRVSAFFMVVESAIHVAGVTREMLRVEGGGMCMCVCVCVCAHVCMYVCVCVSMHA